MSKVFIESGLVFDFTSSECAYRADEVSYNGLSAVDFIVQTRDEFLFVEVKNPDSEESKQHPNRDSFLSDLSEFVDKIATKFKDTLLKELAMGNEFPKPIVYILFLEFDRFDAAQRRLLLERIGSHIPRFHEIGYKRVERISFAICDAAEFLMSYSDFSVIPK